MMEAREFLPSGAITNARIDSLFADALAVWIRDWFPAGRVSLELTSGHRAPRSGVGVVEPGQTQPNASPVVELSPIGRRRLLEAALSVDLEGVQSTEVDREVTDLFLGKVIEDLAAKLAVGLPAGVGSYRVSFDMTLNGQAIAVVSLCRDALIARVRQSMPQFRKRGAFSSGRLEAAGAVLVPIEGVLGTVQLTLRDLTGLACGDVVVLDRQLDEPALLRVTGSREAIRWGRLTPDRDHNAVTVAPERERERLR